MKARVVPSGFFGALDEVAVPAPTKELLTFFDECHHAALKAPAVIVGKRDGKIMADLHATHAEYIKPLISRFFAEQHPWVEDRGHSVPIFRSQFARLLTAYLRDEARAARFDWETECNQLHGGTCSTAFVHDARTVRKPA